MPTFTDNIRRQLSTMMSARSAEVMELVPVAREFARITGRGSFTTDELREFRPEYEAGETYRLRHRDDQLRSRIHEAIATAAASRERIANPPPPSGPSIAAALVDSDGVERDDAKRYRTAVHESGHAICTVALEARVISVTVHRGGGGACASSDFRTFFDRATMSAAGSAAEFLFCHDNAQPMQTGVAASDGAQFVEEISRHAGTPQLDDSDASLNALFRARGIIENNIAATCGLSRLLYDSPGTAFSGQDVRAIFEFWRGDFDNFLAGYE